MQGVGEAWRTDRSRLLHHRDQPWRSEKLPLTSGYVHTGTDSLDAMVQRLGCVPCLGVILDGAHAIPYLEDALPPA